MPFRIGGPLEPSLYL